MPSREPLAEERNRDWLGIRTDSRERGWLLRASPGLFSQIQVDYLRRLTVRNLVLSVAGGCSAFH